MSSAIDLASVDRALDQSLTDAISSVTPHPIPQSSPYAQNLVNSSGVSHPSITLANDTEVSGYHKNSTDKDTLPEFLAPQKGVTPVSRVGQLDAEQLDSDVVHMVALQLRHATNLVDPEFLTRWRPEFDCLLRLLIFFHTTWLDRPTPGSILQNVVYTRHVSRYPTFASSLKAALQGHSDYSPLDPITEGLSSLFPTTDGSLNTTHLTPAISEGPLGASWLAGLPQRLGLHHLVRGWHWLTMTPYTSASSPSSTSSSSTTTSSLSTAAYSLPTKSSSSADILLRAPTTAVPLSRAQKLWWLFLAVLVRWGWDRSQVFMRNADWSGTDVAVGAADGENADEEDEVNMDGEEVARVEGVDMREGVGGQSGSPQVTGGNTRTDTSTQTSTIDALHLSPVMLLHRIFSALFYLRKTLSRIISRLLRLCKRVCRLLLGPHWRMHIFRGLAAVELFVRLAHVLNYAIFLVRGEYRSPIERLLGMPMVYLNPGAPRALALDALQQQVVWRVLAGTVAYAAPLFTAHALPWVADAVYGGKADADASDNSSGSVRRPGLSVDGACAGCRCEPMTQPRVSNCGHWFCCYCVSARVKVGAHCPCCQQTLTGHRPPTTHNTHTTQTRATHMPSSQSSTTATATSTTLPAAIS